MHCYGCHHLYDSMLVPTKFNKLSSNGFIYPLLLQHQFSQTIEILYTAVLQYQKIFDHQIAKDSRVVHENRLAYVCPWFIKPAR